MNKLIPSSLNVDRSRSQSPVNKSTSAISVSREESVTSKASSIISTAATAGTGRRTSLNDLDKELQEFDIDLNKDNVSDTENELTIFLLRSFFRI